MGSFVVLAHALRYGSSATSRLSNMSSFAVNPPASGTGVNSFNEFARRRIHQHHFAAEAGGGDSMAVGAEASRCKSVPVRLGICRSTGRCRRCRREFRRSLVCSSRRRSGRRRGCIRPHKSGRASRRTAANEIVVVADVSRLFRPGERCDKSCGAPSAPPTTTSSSFGLRSTDARPPFSARA